MSYSHFIKYTPVCGNCEYYHKNYRNLTANTEAGILAELAQTISSFDGYGDKDKWLYLDDGTWLCPNCHGE